MLEEPESQRTERHELWEALEAEVQRELAQVGVEADYRSIKHKPVNFRLAIPVLIKLMQDEKYPPLMRNFMAQAVAFKDARPHWDELVRILNDVSSEEPAVFKQGIAVAVGLSAGKEELAQLIECCLDRRYGTTRILLAAGLRRSRDPRAEAALLALSSDDQIGPQVAKWIKQKKRSEKTTVQ
jgi:hypothetical protein